ncbi:hypothetical protein [Aureimonas altamirensis]|uniref:hypothetical protein n=1 Tax=Aureimonas altamirensis TaxID=370622 RepID=UPI0025569E70|nr:hypothetical protein [Aureimonas altamirensis]
MKLPTSDEFGAHVREVSLLADAGIDERKVEFAPPFGPLWSVRLYQLLGRGADERITSPTAFISRMIEQGGEIGARYEREHQANNGFRLVNGMLADAADARGCHVSLDLKAFITRMEPVPVGGQVYLEWRDEHCARGWPWLPDTGKQRVVYLPKDGDDGLERLLMDLASV